MSSFSSTVYLLSMSHSRFIINNFVFAEKGFDFKLHSSGVRVCADVFFIIVIVAVVACFYFLIVFLTFVCHISRASLVCALGNEHHFQFAFFDACECVCARFLFLEFLRKEKNKTKYTQTTVTEYDKKHNANKYKILKWLEREATMTQKGEKAFKRFGPNDP